MRPLTLLGFMGSGKSTVGRALGERLHLPFYDLDEEIERRTNRTIPEIFQREGEAGFREVESKVLKALVTELSTSYPTHTGWILALGGGAPVREENWELIRSLGGVTIWLDLPPELAYRRVEQTDRPLLKQSDPFRGFLELYRSRQRFYQHADLRLDAAKPVATIVSEILSELKRRGEIV